MWFSPLFYSYMYTAVVFWMVNQCCIPRINSWLWGITILYVTRFALLIFCWGFSCLCSWAKLACNIILWSSSHFGLRISLVSQNDLGCDPSFSIIWVCKDCNICSLNSWQNSKWSHLGLDISLWEDFNLLIQRLVIDLLRTSCYRSVMILFLLKSFDMLRTSTNLSISSKLWNLLAKNYS